MEPMSTAEIFIRPQYDVLQLSTCNTLLPHHTTPTYTLYTHLSLCTVLWSQHYTVLNTLMQYITYISNPVTVYIVMLPFVYCYISRRLGLQLLLIISVNDIVNSLLKWAAVGDRPYWYSIFVREFAGTCESGYGLPSGHAANATAIAVTLLYHYSSNRAVYYRLLYGSCFVVTLICWSRIHIGAHFIGQTLLGIATGYVLATAVQAYDVLPTTERVLHHTLQRYSESTAALLGISVTASSIIIVVAMLELALLSTLGVDPLHSVTLKQQGCGNFRAAHMHNTLNSNILQLLQTTDKVTEHASTTDFTNINTPITGVVRDSGLIAALILYLCINIVRLNNDKHSNVNGHSDTVTSISSILTNDVKLLQLSVSSITLTYVQLFGVTYLLTLTATSLASLAPQQHYMLAQYILNYIEFTVLTLCILIIVPTVTKRIVKQ